MRIAIGILIIIVGAFLATLWKVTFGTFGLVGSMLIGFSIGGGIFVMSRKETKPQKSEKMQQPFYCPNCHSLVQYNTRFCGCCGTPLTWNPPDKQQ